MDKFFCAQTHLISIIVSKCQHCNDQHLHTPPDALYMISTVLSLELSKRVLFLDHVLVQEKTTRTPACILFLWFLAMLWIYKD